MKRSIYFLLFFGFLTGTSSAQQLELSPQKLGFDPGELQTITSPYPNSIEPILVPRYRGLLRLGTQNEYGLKTNPRPQEIYRSQAQRGALSRKKQNGLMWLFEYMAMNHARNDIDLQEIRKEFQPRATGGRGNVEDPKNITIYWSNKFKNLARNTLTNQAMIQYFCVGGEDCLSGQQKNKRFRPQFGGGTDEFARLRAFQAFIDTEGSRYLKWVSQLDEKEAYMVGKTYISEYDFNHGGFVLRIGAVEARQSSGSVIKYNTSPQESIFRQTVVNGQPMAGTLVKMSPEEAEALIATLEQQNPRSREVYYVYKAKLQFADKAPAHQGYQPSQLEQIPQNKVEFFLDEQLTQKLFETHLNP